MQLQKCVLRYLKGTKNHGLKYVHNEDNRLIGYTDSDWGGSLDDGKSTSGYVFFLGTNAISWSSKKQKTTALSSTEAEYVSATEASCEAVWLRRILADLEQVQNDPTIIYCDNKSAIAMTENPVFHSQTKHIKLRYHFIRDLVQEEEIRLDYIGTNEQVADMLTKSVSSNKFAYFRDQMRITN